MNKFEIGEVAIYWRPGDVFHAQECEITSGLTKMYYWDSNSPGVIRGLDFLYYIRFCSDLTNHQYAALPSQLRKKPKRRECDKLVSWEDVKYWRPKVMDTVLSTSEEK